MKKLLFALTVLPANAFAQAVASPTAIPVVNALNSANSSLVVHAGTIAIVLGVLAEIGLRLWPTKNPASLLVPVAAALTAVSALCTTAAGILNNVKPVTVGSSSSQTPAA